MKKVLPFIIIPYLLMMGVIFYFYFGPGLIGGYEPLKWQGFETRVPEKFQVKIYHSKGWEVYSLQKMGTLIKIAVKDVFDVTGLPRFYSDIIYQISPSPTEIFFVSKSRRGCEMVYARSTGDVTLYFSVFAPSPYSCRRVMGKLMETCFYNGKSIVLPVTSLPLGVFLADLSLVLGLTLPELLLLGIFFFSGRKPAEDRFAGDPIICEEPYVYYTAQRRYRRRSSLCYMVLTSSRLMVFLFRRLVWEHRLSEPVPDLRWDGKKIIIQTEKEKLTLKPADMARWKTCLNEFLMKGGGMDEKRRKNY